MAYLHSFEFVQAFECECFCCSGCYDNTIQIAADNFPVLREVRLDV